MLVSHKAAYSAHGYYDHKLSLYYFLKWTQYFKNLFETSKLMPNG